MYTDDGNTSAFTSLPFQILKQSISLYRYNMSQLYMYITKWPEIKEIYAEAKPQGMHLQFLDLKSFW